MAERNTGARRFTAAELAAFDGRSGKPSYVGYKGKVYDVSSSSLWTGGEHLDGHPAGKDLTLELADAPHGEEVLVEMPVVGELG